MTIVLAGCYPAGPKYVEDADVVYTTYSKTYDFKAKHTYAIPDSIVVDVDIDHGDTVYDYMPGKFATPILQAIKDNMSANGWTRVDVSANPDVVLTPAGLTSTTYFYSYWYDWWYGGYWGWYGWYYPPYYTVSSYTTGSLIMVMSDPSQAADSPLGRSEAVWVGAMNGLLTYTGNISRVTAGVDQCFKQSPILKIN